jgi:glyoxylase-like metal-dependent hydrolase (beta-lactamase superfamily II)
MVKAKMYIVDNGRIECDLARMVALPKPSTVDEKNSAAEWIKIPVQFLYIDHPDGKLVFDTGCHPKAMEGRWPIPLTKVFPYYHKEEDLFENRLAQIGVKADDIDYVVISHMHFDHTGNLFQFANKKAQIVAQKTELDEAFSGCGYPKEEFAMDGLKWMPVDGDLELFEDVTLLLLPGHTVGLQGLMITLDKEGTFVFSADACYMKRNYGPPARLAGNEFDSTAYMASIERIRQLEKKYKAKVIFGHDWEQWLTIKKLPQYYQ